MINAPTEIQNLLSELMIKSNAYGQFVTVDQDRQPWIRTVHLNMDPETFNIIISAHIDSQKWTHIKSGHTQVSGCYWDKDQKVQIRFQATAQLLSEENTKEPEQIFQMWSKMRPQVRTAYILNEKSIPLHKENINIDPDPHAKNHGIIICKPSRWDVFYESEKEYRFGKRHIYTLDRDDLWVKKDVSSLHEKDILLYDHKS